MAGLKQVEPFYGWRYIEPQYNFKVVEYAINLQGADIIDFELYEQVLDLYSLIKKLEHTERLMTEYAGRYRNIPSSLDQNGETAKVLQAENLLVFYKFRVFARDRTGNLRRVAKTSQEIVSEINEALGPKKTKQVDFSLAREFLESGVSLKRVEEVFVKNYPQYPVELLREEAKKIRNQ